MSTSVTSTGITFPDSTVQTTAASGGGWVLLDQTENTAGGLSGVEVPNADVGNYATLKVVIYNAAPGTTSSRYLAGVISSKDSSGTVDQHDDFAGSQFMVRSTATYTASIFDSGGNGEFHLSFNSTSFWFDNTGALGTELTIHGADRSHFDAFNGYPVTYHTAFVDRNNAPCIVHGGGISYEPSTSTSFYPARFVAILRGGSIVNFARFKMCLYGLAGS
jgi:hypothetical protein